MLKPYQYAERIKLGLYRHYKGNIYRVISLARHSETCEELVVYVDCEDSEKVWVRPADMWCETVIIDGKDVLRFSPIEEERC